MFTCTNVKIWSLLTTTFLLKLVLIEALPSEILIKVSASSAYLDTNLECVLHIPRLLHIYTRGIFISTITLLAVLLAGKWCRHAWRASQDQPLPHVPRRSYSVLAGTPILDDVPLCQPPLGETDDAPHVTKHRGKSSTTASALNNNPSRRNALRDQAALHPLIEEHDPDPGDGDISPVEVTNTSDVLPTFQPLITPHLAQAIVHFLLLFLQRLLTCITSRWIEPTGSPPSNPSQARHPVFTVVALRSSSLPNPKRFSETVPPRAQTLERGSDLTLPYPIETGGLNKSLNTGSKDLSVQDTGNLSVLFVAADDGLGDPNHDLGVFRGIHRAIADPTMRFSSLADRDVTIDTIRQWFIWLYLLAFLNRASLLVFLAGRGNERNRMCLLGKESLGGDNIHEWLSTIRKRFNLRGARTPTIIIDICREKNIPSFGAGNLLNLIRSCSPCQFAQAIGFDPKNVSRSCFYLAFFLAANDRPPTPEEFKSKLRSWLGHVGRLRLWIFDYWHAVVGRCEDCVASGILCDRPGPQTLEDGYAGWADLYRLAIFMVTNNPDGVRVIVNTFMQDMRATGLWVDNVSAPSAPQSSQSAPIVQDASAVASHPRGATLPVSQA